MLHLSKVNELFVSSISEHKTMTRKLLPPFYYTHNNVHYRTYSQESTKLSEAKLGSMDKLQRKQFRLYFV